MRWFRRAAPIRPGCFAMPLSAKHASRCASERKRACCSEILRGGGGRGTGIQHSPVRRRSIHPCRVYGLFLRSRVRDLYYCGNQQHADRLDDRHRLGIWLFELVGQRHQPCLGLRGDRRLLAWPRAIIKRRHRTIRQRALNAALDRLMMHPQGATYRKEGRVFPVGQQHPHPLDPARRFRARARYRNQLGQIIFFDRQLNHLPPCRHDLRPGPANQKPGYMASQPR
jgi:hypothetical protein